MKNLVLAASILCTSFFSGTALAEKTNTQSPQEVITIKKSIIKALLEGEYNYYLDLEKTGHTKWFSPDFYNDTEAFPHLDYIWNESSKYHTNHPFAFDGDKIFEKTGIYIDDIPGKAIVIYDEELGSVSSSGLIKSVLDGDGAQFHKKALLPLENPKENILIFDCLVPELKNCLPPQLSETIQRRDNHHQEVAIEYVIPEKETLAHIKTFENLVFANQVVAQKKTQTKNQDWALKPINGMKETLALTQRSTPQFLAHYKNRHNIDPNVAYLLGK